MPPADKPVSSRSGDVAAFLQQAAKVPAQRSAGAPGRLLFVMDATASREPTWDAACHLQAEMFVATEELGGLAVQLCYYRGFNEFHHSPWCRQANDLNAEMTRVRCLGGHTQIGRALEHAMSAHREQRLQAVVFVGDAMEENPDRLCHLAGQMGVLGLPVFMFQEGSNRRVTSVYRQLARLSGGAYAPFGAGSSDELKALLGAVAVYAAGGRKALQDLRSSGARLLLEQFKD